MKSAEDSNNHFFLEINSKLWDLDKDMTKHITCDNEVILYDFQSIPYYLKANPFIKSGYRAYLSKELCFKSLLIWSNEFVNIWSHLLGLLLFFIVAVYDNLKIIPAFQGTWCDHMVITASLLSYQFAMFCSTGYHLFCCQSEQVSNQWFALDLTGVSIGLLGIYLAGIHYAFSCFQVWWSFYLVNISILSGVTLYVLLQPDHLTSRRWNGRRSLLFSILGIYGFVPLIHWIYLNDGLGPEIVKIFVPKVLILYLLVAIAFLFYISKFPERLFPGKLDYIGSSHQWWHVFILISLYWWHTSTVNYAEYILKNPCK